MARVNKEVAELKTKLRKKSTPAKMEGKLLLSSGSSLVNLAATGRVNGCYVKGCYHYFVGDSGSGKTWLCLTLLAEAALSKRFQNYRLIYDASENGALMDMRTYFGDELVDRLEPPARDEDGNPVYSEYLEEMYDYIDDAFKDGRPFIFVEDSLDALVTFDSEQKYKEQKTARRKIKSTGKGEIPGSYGDGKAKINSSHLRRVITKLKTSGSMVVLISQTRDNIGAIGHGDKKTRAGGKAPTFYATSELWTSKGKPITKTVRGKLRKVGTNMIVKIKKNRTSGRDRIVTVPIYYSHGVDDVGSCVDYLLEEKHWTKGKSGIKCPEWDVVMARDELIRYVEEQNMEDELRAIVSDVWNDIEAQCALSRKKRYGHREDD